MKTKEELNVLKEEVENLSKKLADLTEDELTEVTGGIAPGRVYWKNRARNDSVALSDDEPGSAE